MPGVRSLGRLRCINSGSLIRALKFAKLWPRPFEPSQLTWGVSSLTDKVVDLECGSLRASYNSYTFHDPCNFTHLLVENVEALNKTSAPSGVLDSHRTHVEEQSKE